jgi:hypothetical protein
MTQAVSGAGNGGPVSVTQPDYLWFVDCALDQMVDIVHQLGDEGANRRPDLAGANSAFAILTHCLGVMEFWGGSTVAVRAVTRDREAEFRAEGQVEALVERTSAARRQLEMDMAHLQSSDSPPDAQGAKDAGAPYRATKGAVLFHVLEELFQHLGQMELTRDLLRAGD